MTPFLTEFRRQLDKSGQFYWFTVVFHGTRLYDGIDYNEAHKIWQELINNQ